MARSRSLLSLTMTLALMAALFCCSGTPGPAAGVGGGSSSGTGGGVQGAGGGVSFDSGSGGGEAFPAQHDICSDAGIREHIPDPSRTFFVDADAGVDSNDGGSAFPFRTLTKANALAKPGDLFLVRGVFDGQSIQPPVSGTAEKPIVYRGVDKPIIRNASSGLAILIGARSYVVIEGFELAENKQPADLVNTHHCVLRNNFIHGPGAIRVISSSDNTLEDNFWPRCGTYCVLVGGGSNRNRLVRNQFGAATSLALFFQGAPGMPSSDNIAAHNVIENVEGGAVTLSGSTTRSTVACNVIQNGGTAFDGGVRPAIAISSSDNVLFSNILWKNNQQPLVFQSIAGSNANRNRVERNVGWGNAGPPLRFLMSTPNETMDDNWVQDNVLWAGNLSDDFHWTAAGVPQKIVFDLYHTGTAGWPDGGLGGNIIRHNLIGRDESDIDAGWLYFIGYNKAVSMTLEQAQAKWPTVSGNFEAEPGFIAPDAGDFRINFNSPAGDAGVGRWLSGP